MSKRRPKGMSSYQASWLVGDEEEEDSDEYTDGEDEGDDGDGDNGKLTSLLYLTSTLVMVYSCMDMGVQMRKLESSVQSVEKPHV
jgi:hypothetical protein